MKEAVISLKVEDVDLPITLKPLPTPPEDAAYASHGMNHHDLSPLPEPLPFYTVIQKQTLEIQSLRNNLIRLEQKYIDQLDRMQSAEKAQFQAESELEDLSLNLFEQANEMVASEKKARFEAEKKIQQLESKLLTVTEELENERGQLSELRQKLMSNENKALQQQEKIEQQEKPEKPIDLFDDEAMLAFEGFVHATHVTPLDQLSRLPFLKSCLELDIEPCLRFGNKKHMSTKRILDAVLYHPCFIETEFHKRLSHDDRITKPSITATFRRSSLNFIYGVKSLSPSSTQCYMCGTTLSLQSFRFKLKEQDKDWLLIDRACRDRLVAVCNFFVFIRNIKSGLASQNMQSLFKECGWLRLCMFRARTGIYSQEITFQNTF